jgi:D-alanyl-D-alanine carboxypeptidase (penicillin-binding protein 5/6)
VAPVLLLVSALAPGAGAAAPPEDRYPRAAPSYLVEIDGTLVWGRALDAPRAPASLAKLMTALVVLEDGFDPSAPVAVSGRAASQRGSHLGLRAGERMTAGQLLDGTLVASANDAAYALSERRDGVSAFVARMNSRARQLGLGHTRFANPTGLDAKGQVSTARELLALAKEALAHPEIARRVAPPRATLTTAGGRGIEIASSNALLGLVPGVSGVKTGTTARAGECVIALAGRQGHRVIVVLLGSKDRWWTTAALIEAAFRKAGVMRAAAPGSPVGGAGRGAAAALDTAPASAPPLSPSSPPPR